MGHWLGIACRDLRKQHGRRQVHIAVELDVTESAISNFELGNRWPRDPDATVAAYATDLGTTPRDIWTAAIERWAADTN